MSDSNQQPSIRNVVEEPWQQFPGHFGGALSKALVRPGLVDLTFIVVTTPVEDR